MSHIYSHLAYNLLQNFVVFSSSVDTAPNNISMRIISCKTNFLIIGHPQSSTFHGGKALPKIYLYNIFLSDQPMCSVLVSFNHLMIIQEATYSLILTSLEDQLVSSYLMLSLRLIRRYSIVCLQRSQLLSRLR